MRAHVRDQGYMGRTARYESGCRSLVSTSVLLTTVRLSITGPPPTKHAQVMSWHHIANMARLRGQLQHWHLKTHPFVVKEVCCPAC